jgi:F-type H+-transporting ATPase subunit epsilon
VAQSSFRCKLITPEAVVLDEKVVQVILPAWDGQMGVLPGRAAIVTQLGMGELRIDFADSGQAKGGTHSFFVDDGFAQMVNDELTILAASAFGAEKLSEADALAEVNSLNARRTSNLDGQALQALQKEQRRAEGKLRAARAFKAKGAF